MLHELFKFNNMSIKKNIKQFETLFAKDKNGKIKQWKIHVEDHRTYSRIVYSYGYINGKQIEYNLDVNNGKNIGKKNETTHFQQACSDAQSRWEKKKNINKYVDDILTEEDDKEIEREMDNDEKEYKIPSPMLAQDFNKHNKKIKYPCYIQPKLDGYRCVFSNGKMYSRNGKEYSIMYGSNLHKELIFLEEKFKKEGKTIVLDGELYVHNDLKFEQYGVLRKIKKTEKDDEVINSMRYHVYDIINGESYEQRLQKIKKLFKNNQHLQFVKKVDTLICNNIEDVNKYNEFFLEENYEGSIIRNAEGLYRQKYRSYDLQKYKQFDDAEFEIVDYTLENDVLGKNDRPVVWICETSDNKPFNVPSKGTREERTKLFENGKKYIGKMLSVQYFGLTSDGVPRFPKSLREGKSSIRDE
jgi:ATP-dependent DNA ligase